jgi:hypothetical protein
MHARVHGGQQTGACSTHARVHARVHGGQQTGACSTHARVHARLACAAQMMETPLIRCAHNGHLNMVKFLLEAHADVNAIDLVPHPP